MRDVAQERGGTLTALVVVTQQEAIQRDWDKQCLPGRYENLSVQFVSLSSNSTMRCDGWVATVVCFAWRRVEARWVSSDSSRDYRK